MGKVLPSHWGLKLVDALVILAIVILILNFVAPHAGLSILGSGLHQLLTAL